MDSFVKNERELAIQAYTHQMIDNALNINVRENERQVPPHS
jgi:Golgi nucleoside diphosphatase